MIKVLTVKEPFASLIKNRVKFIETRSWKTNYRGEIYIHSGLAKLNSNVLSRKELSNLYNMDELLFEKILCKCILVDCIYMTEEFIDEQKNKDLNNFISGRYEVGRYAWVLENIEPIEPIAAKGKLGIWNYDLDE